MKSIFTAFLLAGLSAFAASTGDVQLGVKSASGPLEPAWITKSAGKVIGWDNAGTLTAITLGSGGGGPTSWADITGKPTTLSGYGITDALSTTAAAATYQPLIGDGDLTIARTSGLQAALDAKLSTATAASTYQPIITDGSLTIARTSGLQAALDAKLSTATAASTYQPIITDGSLTIARTSGLQAALDAKLASATAASTYQPIITDGSLTIARTSGLQAALDAKLAAATAAATYEPIISAGSAGQYWAYDKSWQPLNAAAVGLGSVENTALSTWAGSTNITTINSTQSISRLANLTDNGFVKTSGSNGGLTVDTNNYQLANAALTAIASLSDSRGLMTNSGSGIVGYIDFSQGGFGASDATKIVQFTSTGSLLCTGDITINSTSGGAFVLQAPASLNSRIITMPDADGIMALTTSNISGTAAGLSATLSVSSGGTGQTSYTDGQLLIGKTTGNTLAKATLTAGSGISITNGSGSITIAATAAQALKTATTDVSISGATAPTSGQVLTATSSTSATWQTPASAGATTDNRFYTADATWTNPSPGTPKPMFVRLLGAGGGGGSGRKGAVGSVRAGGGGGAAGCVVEYWTNTAAFSSTVSVTVGAGGTGGTSQTTNSANGSAGSSGGDTVFGDRTAKGGGAGNGGTNANGTGGAGTSNGNFIGSTTSNSATGGAASTTGAGGATGTSGIGLMPAAGGAGGGITSGDSASGGGNGGAIGNSAIGSVAGGTGGTAGNAGGAGTSTSGSGTGGGGGGGSTSGNAGAGGNGGGYGSGGGGGGAATDSVGNSGAGGNGANGYALIITFL